MSDQSIPGFNSESVRGKSDIAPAATGKRFKALPIITVIVVFVVALVLRAGHNLTLSHQVWLLGDAYNYMSTGNLLLRTFREPGRISQLLSNEPKASHTPDHLKLASQNLGDRISLDGILYPSYLALVQGVAESGQKEPVLENCRKQICLTNSFLDAWTCVFICLAGMIAFGSSVGVLAGAIAAIYPPFVVNTQQCLSEPLACLFISFWLLAFASLIRFSGKSTRVDVLSHALLGSATAAVVMSKPTHTLLIFLTLLFWIGFWFGKNRFSKRQQTEMRQEISSIQRRRLTFLRGLGCVSISILAAAAILLPAAFVSYKICGEWMVSARRSPFESLALTFNASQDGWRAYPYPGPVPTSIAELGKAVQQSITDGDAAELLLITVKKISRLWSGVANDFAYPVLGLGYDVQVFFHRLILVFAFVGFVILLVRAKSIFASRRALFGCMLVLVVSFHSTYLLFEAMPRYAMTALPAVILLAAYGLVSAYRTALTPVHFVLPTTAICVVLGLVQLSANQSSFVAGLLIGDASSLAPWLLGTLQAFMFFGVFQVCIPVLVAGPVTARKILTLDNSAAHDWEVRMICVAGLVTVSAVSIACLVGNRGWSEWECDFSNGEAIKQVIAMPPDATPAARGGLILFDCASKSLLPNLAVKLNGVKVDGRPVPFAEIADVDIGILDGLKKAECAMGNDSRGFRQWWAIPIPPEMLKHGEDNEVILTAPLDNVTVFGDYDVAGSSVHTLLPSLWRFSYSKAYCSTERGDPRIFEKQFVRGKASSSFYKSGIWSNDDLAPAWGCQRGGYRIRIATVMASPTRPSNSPPPADFPRLMVLLNEKSIEVDGRDPSSMFPIRKAIKLLSPLPPEARFEFSCEVRSKGSSSDASIAAVFGTEPGWSSQWQPMSFPINREWRTISFSDVLPKSASKDCEVRLMVSPFHPDLIYTNRRRALASKVEIRNASLKLLPPTGLGVVKPSEVQLF